LRALHPATLRDIGIEPDRIGQSVEAMLAAEADEPAPKRDNGDGFRAPAIFVQGAWPCRWGRAN